MTHDDNTALAEGWRDGFPAAGAQVQRPRERPVFQAPHNRWAFSHLRELQPTRNVPRGPGPVSVLPRPAGYAGAEGYRQFCIRCRGTARTAGPLRTARSTPTCWAG